MENDYHDILTRDVPSIEEKAESHFQVAIKEPRAIGIENLLHPVVLEHAYQHYTNGHLRDAVLNAFIAVFDLIRDRTGSELDGAKLATQIFSVNNPQLVFSETNTDSGRNDQTGFLRIFEGAYIGIRNPKAHTLQHDLTENTAAQYLVFASLLARRVSEATKP
jgi:uncharacterized protein (TIGR02391 family)